MWLAKTKQNQKKWKWKIISSQTQTEIFQNFHQVKQRFIFSDIFNKSKRLDLGVIHIASKQEKKWYELGLGYLAYVTGSLADFAQGFERQCPAAQESVLTPRT